MNKGLKILLAILLGAYIVSPVYLVSACPIDDMNYHHLAEVVSTMPNGISKARSQCRYSLGQCPWVYF